MSEMMLTVPTSQGCNENQTCHSGGGSANSVGLPHGCCNLARGHLPEEQDMALTGFQHCWGPWRWTSGPVPSETAGPGVKLMGRAVCSALGQIQSLVQCAPSLPLGHPETSSLSTSAERVGVTEVVTQGKIHQLANIKSIQVKNVQ